MKGNEIEKILGCCDGYDVLVAIDVHVAVVKSIFYDVLSLFITLMNESNINDIK